VEADEVAVQITRWRPQNIPAIGVIEKISPQKYWRNPEDSLVVDFGVNVAGTLELDLAGQEPGKPLLIEYVEQLAEGDLPDRNTTGFGATHLRQLDVCVPGEEQQGPWRASWGYKGFRYVLIKGWKGQGAKEKMSAVVLRNKIAKTGSFSCSEPLLNDLYQIACRSMEGNLHGVFEDCPAREKCGWLGDVLAAYRSWWLNFDLGGFSGKFLDDMVSENSEESVPFAIVGGRRKCGQWLDFGAACVVLPHVHYHQTGDVSILRRHFVSMQRFCERAFLRLSIRLEEAARPVAAGDWYDVGLGDWYDLPLERGPDNGGFSVSSSALLMTCLRIVEALQRMNATCKILNRSEEAKEWAHVASIIERKTLSTFYQNDEVGFGAISPNAMALYLRLCGKESVWLNAIGQQLKRQDWHANVGCFGHGILTPVLAASGRADWAFKTLMAKGYPGFRDCLERGATTLWEDQGAQSAPGIPSIRSLNHPFHAGFVAFLHQAVGGVRADEGSVAWDRLVFELPLVTALNEGMTAHETPRGKVSSQWRRSGDRVDWHLVVPPGATGSIFFFKANYENLRVESSRHTSPFHVLKEPHAGKNGLHGKISSGSHHFSWGNHVFGHLSS
jgi:alpha-L-rhamnosidase